jgi:hypothetical protein
MCDGALMNLGSGLPLRTTIQSCGTVKPFAWTTTQRLDHSDRSVKRHLTSLETPHRRNRDTARCCKTRPDKDRLQAQESGIRRIPLTNTKTRSEYAASLSRAPEGSLDACDTSDL